VLQRYLIMGPVPELRPDPIQADASAHELELLIPVPVYWDILEVIKEIRYARFMQRSAEKDWKTFFDLVYPCILLEKDRNWFWRGMNARQKRR